MKYSLIIPTRNRENNLACCLMALLMQTYSAKYWEVIIADESDRMAWQIIGAYRGQLNIRYFWQRAEIGNPGPAKNVAARIAVGEALIFLDSDVILNNNALASYDELHTEYPEAIICGRYDWLLPMRITPDKVAKDFHKVVSNGFPKTIPSPGPLPGVDPRWRDVSVPAWDKPSRLSSSGKPFSLAMFGGNTLVPKALFEKSGGFDPNIKGHGGEDNMLGWRMFEIGAEAMFTDRTIGWHIHHERNQAQNDIDVRRNIAYIESRYREFHVKYGIIADTENKIVYCKDGTFVPDYEKKVLKVGEKE